MHITVAICTWNRCELLRQTLDQMTRLIVPPGVSWELLIVNNNCADATDAVIEEFSATLPLGRLFEPLPGLSHARNRALREAAGDYILWIDDDVLVDGEWLVAFVKTIERHPSAAAVGGPITPWFPIEPDPVLMAAFPFLKNGFCGLDHGPEEIVLGPEQTLFGANMAMSRLAIGTLTFNPRLGTVSGSGMAGEETDFIERLRKNGGPVLWSPAMRVKHYVDPSRMNLRYLIKYYEDRGRSFIRGQARTHDQPAILGAPRWIWRLMVQEYLRYALLRVTPFRARALCSLREYSRFRGMVRECRAQRTVRGVASERQTGDRDLAA
jgi:glycosyltransferase involved in cell wall biosynthesis